MQHGKVVPQKLEGEEAKDHNAVTIHLANFLKTQDVIPDETTK